MKAVKVLRTEEPQWSFQQDNSKNYSLTINCRVNFWLQEDLARGQHELITKNKHVMSRVSIITFRDATSPIDVEEPVSCTPFLNESGKLLDCSTRNFLRIPRSSSFCLRHSITCRIASQHSNRNKILQSRTITFVIMYTRRKSSTQHK